MAGTLQYTNTPVANRIGTVAANAIITLKGKAGFADLLDWGTCKINGTTITDTSNLLLYIADIGAATSATSIEYASKLGTSSAYLSYSDLSPIKTWYDTIKGTDEDTIINRWDEIVNFVSGFEETPDLATFLLNNYVSKSGSVMTGTLTVPTLNVTGSSVFTSPINGNLLGNSSTADRLKLTALIGSATLPVYFSGGVPIACTALGTASTHNHGDYMTSIGIVGTTITWSKGGSAQTALLLPTYTNNVTSHLYVGATGATANLTGDTTLTDPYLSLVEGSTLDSLVQVKAGTGISVLASANGVITITNTAPDINHNTDTKYYITLNGTKTGDSSGTSLGSFYAYDVVKQSGNSGITLSLVSSSWTDSSISIKSLDLGTYAIQIIDSAGAIFSGVFSTYHSDASLNNDLDEIPLHMSGSAANKARIYAATLNGILRFSSLDASSTSHTLTIYTKRII